MIPFYQFTHPAPAARILFVGDPHGDFTGIPEAVERSSAQHVILLGDLECSRRTLARLQHRLQPAGARLWWIYGNHDEVRPALQACLHGRVVTMAGLRVGGINMPYDAHSTSWTDDTILRAYPPHSLDILVSHDGPSALIVSRLASHTGAHSLFHGHYIVAKPTVTRQGRDRQQCWGQERQVQGGEGANAGDYGGEAPALQRPSRLVEDLTCVLQVRTFYGNAGRRQHGAWGAGSAAGTCVVLGSGADTGPLVSRSRAGSA